MTDMQTTDYSKITDMTDKTIEKAAKELANFYYSQRSTSPPIIDGQVEDNWREFTSEAKVVIEALDIIILPADAEPMKGDLCYMRFKMYNENLYDEEETLCIYNTNHKNDLLVKIIQRNGKSVIQEVE